MTAGSKETSLEDEVRRLAFVAGLAPNSLVPPEFFKAVEDFVDRELKRQAPVQGDEALRDKLADVVFGHSGIPLGAPHDVILMLTELERLVDQDRKAFAQRVLNKGPKPGDENPSNDNPTGAYMYLRNDAIRQYNAIIAEEAGL